MNHILRCILPFSLVVANAAGAQELELMGRLFSDRAVAITASAPESCAADAEGYGSGVVLSATGGLALVATAAHVIEQALCGSSGGDFGAIEIEWSAAPADCPATPDAETVFQVRPDRQNVPSDIALLIVRIGCAAELSAPPEAWRDGTPSYGLDMAMIDVSGVFRSGEMSAPFYLSDTCIRAGDCFEGGYIALQTVRTRNDSGSAVFSERGFVGLVEKEDRLVSAPVIAEALRACAVGDCQVYGASADLSPFVMLQEAALAPAQVYAAAGRPKDTAAIVDFLSSVPAAEQRANTENVCDIRDGTDQTELTFDNGDLRVVNFTVRTSERCSMRPLLTSEERTICSAPIDALSGAIEIWSGPTLRLRCTSGDCFKCSRTYTAEHQDAGSMEETRDYRINEATVYAGGQAYYSDGLRNSPDKELALVNMVRALSRVISGGSDEAFCASSPQYC